MTALKADIEVIERLVESLKPEQRQKILETPQVKERLKQRFIPQIGPQTEAYESEADVLLYGGQGGSGKTGLICGLALMKHERALICRRQLSDLEGGLIEDLLRMYGSRNGYRGGNRPRLQTDDGRFIEFGGLKLPGDEQAWKGNPHDLLAVDEVCQCREDAVRFLMGWVRSITPGQRKRVVLATNPPESQGDGEWVMKMFGPWLDPNHPWYRPNADGPYGYKCGELLWVVTDDEGDDLWVEGPEAHMLPSGRTVRPHSRTFIPARLADNRYLAADGEYQRQLDNLIEPVRSAVRDGNWLIAHKDHEWQLYPTAWVMQAMERWRPELEQEYAMTVVSVDPAGGGKDSFEANARRGGWFSDPLSITGPETDDPEAMGMEIMKLRRDGCPIIIDVGGGYASGIILFLKQNGIEVYKFNGAETSHERTMETNLPFKNKRAEAHWRFREALDPHQDGGSQIILPPDPELKTELTTIRWDNSLRVVEIMKKDDIRKILKRSPGKADVCIMSLQPGEKAVRRDDAGPRRTPKVITSKVRKGGRFGSRYKGARPQ